MQNSDTLEIVKSYLINSRGDSYTVLSQLWDHIVDLAGGDDELGAKLFRDCCNLYGTVDSEDSDQLAIGSSASDLSIMRDLYGDLVDALLESLLKRNEPEEAFYSTLWRQINSDLLFDTDEKKRFAFYYILIDPRIPYFAVNQSALYSMSNRHFSELRENYPEIIQKTRFLVSTPFSQRTERASALLCELGIEKPSDFAGKEEIEDYEKKLIVMVEIVEQCKLAAQGQVRAVLDRIR